jgi:hypothetical protein
MTIHAAARADDELTINAAKAERGRKGKQTRIDRIAAQGNPRSAAVHDHGREHAKRVPPNTIIRRRLLHVSNIGQLANESERIVVAKGQMIDPINEPSSGVVQ